MCGKCDAFFNWQDVKLQCTVDPERVVSFLISIHQYDLLDTWCEDFDVSEDLLQVGSYVYIIFCQGLKWWFDSQVNTSHHNSQ